MCVWLNQVNLSTFVLNWVVSVIEPWCITNSSDSFNNLEFRVYDFFYRYLLWFLSQLENWGKKMFWTNAIRNLFSFTTAKTEKKIVEKISGTSLWKDLMNSFLTTKWKLSYFSVVLFRHYPWSLLCTVDVQHSLEKIWQTKNRSALPGSLADMRQDYHSSKLHIPRKKVCSNVWNTCER